MERIIIRGLTQRWHCVYEELHCSWSIEAKIYKNDNSFKGGSNSLKRVETAERKMEYLINQTRES